MRGPNVPAMFIEVDKILHAVPNIVGGQGCPLVTVFFITSVGWREIMGLAGRLSSCHSNVPAMFIEVDKILHAVPNIVGGHH
jgi:ABC-type phosphate transport system permease subunit